MSKNGALKILFIGNSFTQRNDVPGMFAAMAAELGVVVQTTLIAAGGASLRRHWNAGQAAEDIAAGGYDLVVLQEQSTLPIKNPGRMAENVRLFAPAIQQSGARMVLYQTWARQHALATQSAINAAYRSLGQELGAIVVPVGEVWQAFLHDDPGVALYDRDQSHPSVAGSFLAACVFVRVLIGQNPASCTTCPPGLAPEVRAQIAAAVEQLPWQV